MLHDDTAQLLTECARRIGRGGNTAVACPGCHAVLIGDRMVRGPSWGGELGRLPAQRHTLMEPGVGYPWRTRPVPRCGTPRVPEPYATKRNTVTYAGNNGGNRVTTGEVLQELYLRALRARRCARSCGGREHQPPCCAHILECKLMPLQGG
jgi:hypothetical protein